MAKKPGKREGRAKGENEWNWIQMQRIGIKEVCYAIWFWKGKIKVVIWKGLTSWVEKKWPRPSRTFIEEKWGIIERERKIEGW